MDMFRILEPGAFTTAQDHGRYGYQRYGIPVSGALDKFAYHTANLLVGNPVSEAVLEMTFTGPKVEVLSSGIAAITGAEVPVQVNKKPQAMWESFHVSTGDLMSIRTARKGLRAYLAVNGGIEVPEIMGSKSTCVRGGIGGFNGRAIAKGDVLARGEAAGTVTTLALPEELRPSFHDQITLRAVPGPQDDYFDVSLDLFFSTDFTVTAQADRTGYRLDGPTLSFRQGLPASIISEPSLAGVVQVPPDGKPIILLTELTVGGYAKIATVITPDLDLVAQARPGDTIRFERISLNEALVAHREYREKLFHIRSTLG